MDESVKDLIVDVNPTEVSIALMENHRLIELRERGQDRECPHSRTDDDSADRQRTYFY